jgi:hypothetical protein
MMEEQILEYIRQLRTTTTPSITTKATKIEATTPTTATTTSINSTSNQELKFCFDNVACIYLAGGGSFTMLLFFFIIIIFIYNKGKLFLSKKFCICSTKLIKIIKFNLL